MKNSGLPPEKRLDSDTGGIGIHVCSRYSASSAGVEIENILFSNILMDVRCPVAVCSDVRGVHDETVKPIRNIVFRNLNGTACHSFIVESNHRGDIRNIIFSGINMKLSSGDDVKDGPGILYGESVGTNAPAAFHLANVENVAIRDAAVEWGKDSQHWKYGVMAENTDPLTIAPDCDFGKPELINAKLLSK